jgi:hypothetical protein
MPVSRKKSEKAQDKKLTVSAGSDPSGIDTEAIARLAHSYWEARGCAGGSPEEDWFRAEQELSSRMSRAASN